MVWETAKSLGIETESAADIASKLSHVTASDITTKAIRELLRERKLWFQDPITGARDRGSIGVAMKAGFPDVLHDAMVELAAAIYDGAAEFIRTATDSAIAERVHTALTALMQVGAMTSDDCEAFVALGGGQPFSETTADDVTAAQTADENRKQRQGALDAIRDRASAALTAAEAEFVKPDATPESITAAGEGAF